MVDDLVDDPIALFWSMTLSSELGIAPVHLAPPELNEYLMSLTPEERRRLKRKYRKVVKSLHRAVKRGDSSWRGVRIPGPSTPENPNQLTYSYLKYGRFYARSSLVNSLFYLEIDKRCSNGVNEE